MGGGRGAVGECRRGWAWGEGLGKGWVGMANGIMTGRAMVAFLNGEAT